jgi:deoxyribose-phosphate aldolase
MVINIGALKDRNLNLVARDILGVVQAAHEGGILLKVIIEAALLTDEEKQIACLLAKEAGADYVKTSTGFSIGGATVEDVALMRRTVGPLVGVKAAGGIRTKEDVLKMIEAVEDFENMIKAGATRIGASAGVRIIKGDDKAAQPAAKADGPKNY